MPENLWLFRYKKDAKGGLMPRNEEGQYTFPAKLTIEEFCKLVELDDGVVVTTIRLGAGYRRRCPGRNGQPCKGDGWQDLELRNMGKPGKPMWEVRDQPCCPACRR
jgi:hypothetical protein